MNHSHLSVSHGENYVIPSFLGLFIYVVLINAWVTEDAYITFRVVDNFVNGYGLTWNVNERVQVFTNPLWLFVHIPFYFVTEEIFLSTIFISVIFDIATFLISARLFKSSVSFIFAFLLIPLVLSRSFTEYATSGLENPLTFFLLALFCMVIFRKRNLSSFSFVFYCFLIAGLAAVNRLDTLIFYLPTLLFLFISRFSRKVLVAVLLGLLPLILWELFSLFYYGFLFPNTAYAKLHTGVETEAYIKQGIVYAIDLIKNDPFSSVTLILAISLTLYSISHSLQNRKFFTFESLLGIGLLLYCLYIVKVGGDFMSGRFWSAPFFLAVLLLNFWLHPYDHILRWRSYIIGAVLIGIFVSIFPKSQTQATVFSSGIADERGCYVETNGLLNYIRTTPTNHGWANSGIESNKRSKKTSFPLVEIRETIGMHGFYSGHSVMIIDQLALSDPLLARLPIATTDGWRIGHFYRQILQGYLEFHQTGSFEQMSKTLAEYYKPLHFIISGPLFDLERLKTIWKFNSGEYDHYLQEYLLEG